MTASYHGSLSLGGAIPLLIQAQAQLNIVVGASLPDLQARLAGAIALAARLQVTPPSLTGNIEIAAQLLATLEASVSLGLPGVDFQLTAAFAIIAQLELTIGAINAAAELSVELGVGGVHVYSVSSTSAELGTDLQQALADGLPGTLDSAQCFGVLVVASAPEARAAISATFGLAA